MKPNQETLTESFVQDYYIKCKPDDSVDQPFTTSLEGKLITRLKGYAIIPREEYEELQSHLRLLTEAVLVAHSDCCDYCPHTTSEPDCYDTRCKNNNGCQCHACKVAREVLG